MKAFISVLLFIAAAATCSAFAPSARAFSGRLNTPLNAETEKKKEIVLDKNFNDVNIVKLLGLKRLKKKIRKNKSKANRAK